MHKKHISAIRVRDVMDSDVGERIIHKGAGGIYMRRRKIYLAAILAAVMVFQAPVMVFADNETTEQAPDGSGESEVITYDGDVSLSDDGDLQTVGAYNNGTTTAGNVTSTVSKEVEEVDEDGNTVKDEEGNPVTYLPTAVEAMSGGTTNVASVQAENTQGVLAMEQGTVNVTGDVAVKGGEPAVSADNGTVNVGGDVTSSRAPGVTANGDSAVTVGGDVTSQSAPAVEAYSGAAVTVGGDVTSQSESAIIADSKSSVSVKGDVSGTEGVIITLGEDGGGKVELLGNTAATSDQGSAICIDTELNDKDGILGKLPTIVVGSLETKSGGEGLWIGGENNENVDRAVYEAVYQQILYYIAKDKFANATLSVAGANAYKNGYTSNEGKSLTVTISTSDGYEVSSVTGTSVVRNADGTYTVIVQRDKGIDINAVISAIVKAQQGSCGSNNNNNNTSDSPAPVVVVPAYAAAQKQFQTAIAAQLKTLPAGGTLRLDMKEYISFNRKTFEILAQRKDVDIQITYTWKGKKYLVVIPAGYDILSLLDANGYCGCLYLNSIFGSTELAK